MTQYPMSVNGSLLILNDTSTVEEVDLFNNLQNIVVTNADEDVWQQIGKVNLNAHNPNHGAPKWPRTLRQAVAWTPLRL